MRKIVGSNLECGLTYRDESQVWQKLFFYQIGDDVGRTKNSGIFFLPKNCGRTASPSPAVCNSQNYQFRRPKSIYAPALYNLYARHHAPKTCLSMK